jgi:hypothetical protein
MNHAGVAPMGQIVAANFFWRFIPRDIFKIVDKNARWGVDIRYGKIKFGKLNVCTYICVVKLEQAIQSTKFKSEVQKAGLNILYTAWWLKTVMSKELKEFGLTMSSTMCSDPERKIS